jgi:hypothetical protein
LGITSGERLVNNDLRFDNGDVAGEAWLQEVIRCYREVEDGLEMKNECKGVFSKTNASNNAAYLCLHAAKKRNSCSFLFLQRTYQRKTSQSTSIALRLYT